MGYAHLLQRLDFSADSEVCVGHIPFTHRADLGLGKGTRRINSMLAFHFLFCLLEAEKR